MFLLFLVGLGAAMAWYVGAPLRWRGAAPAMPRAASIEALRARRDTLLRQLKELEFDRSMRKVEAADYARLRADVSVEAAAVLQRLEKLEKAEATPRSAASANVSLPPPALDATLDAEIEAEILVARARRTKRRLELEEAAPANHDATNRNGAAQDAGWRCASCGRGMGASDVFCATCGTRRAANEPQMSTDEHK